MKLGRSATWLTLAIPTAFGGALAALHDKPKSFCAIDGTTEWVGIGFLALGIALLLVGLTIYSPSAENDQPPAPAAISTTMANDGAGTQIGPHGTANTGQIIYNTTNNYYGTDRGGESS
jgi:hypothetical protein